MVVMVLSYFVAVLFNVLYDGKEELGYTGVLADESIVSSIRDYISGLQDEIYASIDDVFWTESGKVWHKRYDCSHLVRSKTIIHGTVEEAMLAGKEKECESCKGQTVWEIYESIANNEYQNGDVFFTQPQGVWHTDINCPSILGADKIYFADITTAKLLGKISACNECK